MMSRIPLLRLTIFTRVLPHRYLLTRTLHTVHGQKTATTGSIRILTTARRNPCLNHVGLWMFKPSSQFRAYNNNTNCDDCANCTNCTNCDDCTNCKNCTGCKNCDNSKNCTGCKNCDNCKNCTDCTDCVGLTNAYGVKGVKAGELKREGGECLGDATSSISQSQDGGKSYIVSGDYADCSKVINAITSWGNRVTSAGDKRRGSYLGNPGSWSRMVSRYIGSVRRKQGLVHNTDCTDCKVCTDCNSCTNCTNCANCTDCEDCLGLYGARGLKGVKVSRLSWFGGYKISITTSDGCQQDGSYFGFSLSWDPFNYAGQSVSADSGFVWVNDKFYFRGQRIILNDGLTRTGRSLRKFLKRLIIVGGLVTLMVRSSRRKARDEERIAEMRRKDEKTRRRRRT